MKQKRIIGSSKSGKSVLLLASFLVIAITVSGCAHFQLGGFGKPSQKDLTALIADLPANGIPDGMTFCKKALDMGPGAIEGICDLLVEPGKGDDAKPRFAIHGIALYVHGPGLEKDRVMFSKAIARSAKRSKITAVQTFLVSELQVSGRQEVVPVLVSFLNDPIVCEYAAQALLTIRGEKTTLGFRNALKTAPTACHVTIIDALGVLQDAASVNALMAEANVKDETVSLAALYALANIGDPIATDTLAKAVQTDSLYTRAKIISYNFLLAERLAEKGNKEKAVAICRGLMKDKPGPEDIGTQCAALSTLSKILGIGVMDDLLTALMSDNPQIRGQAMNISMAFPGVEVTRKWIAAYGKATPEIRAEILRTLARRGDKEAVPTMKAALSDPEQIVRLAAVETAPTLDMGLLGDIVQVFKSADKVEREATKASLVKLPGDSSTDEIASFMSSEDANIRAGVLDVLAARGAAKKLDVVLKAANDADSKVRLAALKSAGTLATDTDVPALVDLVVLAQNEDERKEAEKSLALTLERCKEKEKVEDAVLKPISTNITPEAQASLLLTLSKVGTDKAAATVVQFLKGKNKDVVDAAVRSLSDWPTAKPMDSLADLAKNSKSQVHQVLALRGYVRMIALPSERSNADTLKLFQNAMKLAQREEDKKTVIGAMGKAANAEVLGEVVNYVGQSGLKDEAIVAALSISKVIALGSPDAVAKALDKVQKASTDEKVLSQIKEIQDLMTKYEDYITAWEASGPYTQKGKKTLAELMEAVFPPEEADAKDVKWAKVTADTEQPYLVDFYKMWKKEICVGYLRTKVWSPKEQKAQLEAGSDDGLRVWINGVVVSEKNEARGFEPGMDKAEITLKEGWNTILMKVTQGSAAWSAGARLRATDGSHLPDLKIGE